MILSRAAWYGILVVIEIGKQSKPRPDRPVLAKDIVPATKGPPEYVSKVLTQLVKARLRCTRSSATSSKSRPRQCDPRSPLRNSRSSFERELCRSRRQGDAARSRYSQGTMTTAVLPRTSLLHNPDGIVTMASSESGTSAE